jgi:hypothetical protein
MKRSEMVNFLLEILLPEAGYTEFGASELLRAIEEKGMLPPIEPGRTVYDLDLGVPEWEDEKTDEEITKEMEKALRNLEHR